MSKTKPSKSKYIHLVISPSEPPSIDSVYEILTTMSIKTNKVLKCVVSEEYGESGDNPHIDSFIELSQEIRPDNFRRKLLTYDIFKSIPKSELINIKCYANYVDPDPKYGYGYSTKEENRYLLYNVNEVYMQECREYYNSAKSKVKSKSVRWTINTVSEEFMEYYRENYTLFENGKEENKHNTAAWNTYGRTGSIEFPFKCFAKHMMQSGNPIPFSILLKIRSGKLLEYVRFFTAEY